LQLQEYLHKNSKGKKGLCRNFAGVLLLKPGSKRPLFTGIRVVVTGGYTVGEQAVSV
jgi:hypothetical protein